MARTSDRRRKGCHLCTPTARRHRRCQAKAASDLRWLGHPSRALATTGTAPTTTSIPSSKKQASPRWTITRVSSILRYMVMWRGGWASTAFCSLVVVLAGCNSNPQAAPAASEVSPVVSSTDLGCYGSPASPPEEMTIYFDSVALPTSDRFPTALQTGTQGEYFRDSAGRLFAKTGLYFKPGNAFEMIVPDDLRDRLSIGWGSGSRSWRVVVGECADIPSEWVALPGGYWVADPMCAELILRSAGTDQRVKIGLGTPCSGQAPPPQPSDV